LLAPTFRSWHDPARDGKLGQPPTPHTRLGRPPTRDADLGRADDPVTGLRDRAPRAEQIDRDELAEAVAEQLLARYGVVFRDLVVRESFTLPWREVAWALRRLEARGQIRGGRFVGGFVGEQYALPEAVDALRRVRRTPPNGEIVRLSACDPLNLVGIIVPGNRVPAQSGHSVAYRDGEWLAERTPSNPPMRNERAHEASGTPRAPRGESASPLAGIQPSHESATPLVRLRASPNAGRG
jgi:hypothetical protein